MAFANISPIKMPTAPAETLWPHGKKVVVHKELQPLLEHVAQKFARDAVFKFGSPDALVQLEAAIAAGTATELLAKAYLCSVDPAMLAERNERKTSLVLTGHGHLTKAGESYLDIKTLGARAALIYASEIPGGPAFNPNTQGKVLEVRNAAAHMGLVSEDELRTSIGIMVRLVHSLVSTLGTTDDDFWGDDLKSAARDILEVATDELRKRVLARKDEARAQLHHLVGGLEDGVAAVVLQHLSGTKRPTVDWSESAEPWECPVCEQNGWLVCDVERGPLQGEAINLHDYEIWVDRTAIPYLFQCPVCELELTDDELVEAGMPSTLELEADYEPVEAQEPYDDHE